jgi:hypothetical protein
MLTIAVVACASCSEDVPTIQVTATAMMTVQLAAPDDSIPATLGHYRWEVVETPPDVTVPTPTDETATITVAPPARGIYVYARWFVGQADEQLSCHVVVEVHGALPSASVAGPAMGAVGDAAVFDGTASSSPEHLALEYQWRLALRPESSTAALADATSPMLTFTPDVAGAYVVELRVFDGELWSAPATATLQAR